MVNKVDHKHCVSSGADKTTHEAVHWRRVQVRRRHVHRPVREMWPPVPLSRRHRRVQLSWVDAVCSGLSLGYNKNSFFNDNLKWISSEPGHSKKGLFSILFDSSDFRKMIQNSRDYCPRRHDNFSRCNMGFRFCVSVFHIGLQWKHLIVKLYLLQSWLWRLLECYYTRVYWKNEHTGIKVLVRTLTDMVAKRCNYLIELLHWLIMTISA